MQSGSGVRIAGPLTVIVSCVVTMVLGSAGVAQTQTDWRGFRGNHGDGVASPGSVLSSADDCRLNLRWKKPLGSGYSGIAISGGQLVTMYSAAEQDKLVCFDAVSGSKRWEFPIDQRYAGHDGSFDGPIATPVIDGQTVVALSAQGKLLAVQLDDGRVRWTKQLTDDPIRAPKPMYGFSTSPIVVERTLIVICGAEDGFLMGLDIDSGNVKWQSGSDQAQCQSPILMTLGGKPVVVAAGMNKLIGVEPATGKILFEIEHQGTGARGAMSMVPVQTDGNGVFVAHDDRSGMLLQISSNGDSFVVKRKWTSTAIRNTYNVPVYHDGILFGYNNRMLTAVNTETGTEVWRSRQPGDGFHIGIDRHLIVATKKGALCITRADPAKFEELARLQLFDDLVWSIPSFSNNAVYIRSLGEIACVDIRPAKLTADTSNHNAKLPMSFAFQQLIESLNAETDPGKKQKLIDGFVKLHPQSPYIEDGIAHFYYHGDAQDVAIGSDLFGSRQEKKMRRAGNLFYYPVRLEPDQRANYTYFIDYKSSADPRNPNTPFVSQIYVDDMEIKVATTTQAEPVVMSWFAMPDWKQPGYLVERGDSRKPDLKGSVIEHKFAGKFPGDVYLPPGYETGEDRYPVVYVHGPEARSEGGIDVAVDWLIQAETIRPCILVFLPLDIGDPDPLKYPQFVGHTLVPEIDRTFRTLADRNHRANYATGFYAPMALLTAATHPDVFSATAVQSPFIFGADAEGAFNQFKKIRQPYRFYCDWGRFDMFNPDENWDMREIASRAYDQVQEMQNMSVAGGVVSDASGWRSWQTRFDRVIGFLVGDQTK